MIWINIKRILKSGFFGFWRNGFVSLSSVFVMIVALGVLGSIVFANEIMNTTLRTLQSKVDVNVYFLLTAEESDILTLKSKIEALPETQEVVYVSREQVLQSFRDRHTNDAGTIGALDELDENPLGAVINIRAKETSQYESISKFLSGDGALLSDGQNIIEKINYNQNKVAIDKLTSIIESAKSIGLFVMIILILMSILITFNTIRLAIYIAREEISVMKLVGASSMYIRGPFVVGGILYGAIAGVITLALFHPVTVWLGKEASHFFIDFNIFDYYVSHFFQIALLVLGAGIAMGAVSSFLAVRRYLR